MIINRIKEEEVDNIVIGFNGFLPKGKSVMVSKFISGKLCTRLMEGPIGFVLMLKTKNLINGEIVHIYIPNEKESLLCDRSDIYQFIDEYNKTYYPELEKQFYNVSKFNFSILDNCSLYLTPYKSYLFFIDNAKMKDFVSDNSMIDRIIPKQKHYESPIQFSEFIGNDYAVIRFIDSNDSFITNCSGIRLNKYDFDKKQIKDMDDKFSNDHDAICEENGIKYDIRDDKLRWDLLPLKEIEDIVKVYHEGAKKYGENTWQNLDNAYQRYKGALLRHLLEYEKGNRYDEETGCAHLAQVAWNAIAMLHVDKAGNGYIVPEISNERNNSL